MSLDAARVHDVGRVLEIQAFKICFLPSRGSRCSSATWSSTSTMTPWRSRPSRLRVVPSPTALACVPPLPDRPERGVPHRLAPPHGAWRPRSRVAVDRPAPALDHAGGYDEPYHTGQRMETMAPPLPCVRSGMRRAAHGPPLRVLFAARALRHGPCFKGTLRPFCRSGVPCMRKWSPGNVAMRLLEHGYVP